LFTQFSAAVSVFLVHQAPLGRKMEKWWEMSRNLQTI